MLFYIVTFNLWLHYNKLLTYLTWDAHLEPTLLLNDTPVPVEEKTKGA